MVGAGTTTSPNFYPRSPCGERLRYCRGSQCSANFYPRSPCGERLLLQGSAKQISHFYPRSPCGERPKELTLAAKNAVFLSTLSLRRATAYRVQLGSMVLISIHALLAESDIHLCTSVKNMNNFYPRSPCGERQKDGTDDITETLFLSTLSLRRATITDCHI